jgi:hypothetical protein
VKELAVAVKIEEGKKTKVDRFLASFMLQENLKITMQEAVGIMIDYALENEEEIIKKLKELPVSKKTLCGKCLKTQNIGE